MIAFVTLYEGGYWIQTTTEHLEKTHQLGYHTYAAVRIGAWIYDFDLKRLGLNPKRKLT